MCWNASISINTYIFSTFATIFAYANQIIDIYSLVFLQSLFIMQLLEYVSDASHLRPLANILYGRKHFRINYYPKSV